VRGTADGLLTPHPLAATLPGLLQQDDFLIRLCGGLDPVLAPVFATLNGFGAYLDPHTIPEDMIGWLAGWIGLTFDAGQTPQRRRDLLAAGAEQLGRRGTVLGLTGAIEAVFDVTPEILESGGAGWSAKPGASLPGAALPRLLVRLRVPDPNDIDLPRLDAVVAAVKPAHVPHRVEVVKTSDVPSPAAI
jgi:phage tail-like protein